MLARPVYDAQHMLPINFAKGAFERVRAQSVTHMHADDRPFVRVVLLLSGRLYAPDKSNVQQTLATPAPANKKRHERSIGTGC